MIEIAFRIKELTDVLRQILKEMQKINESNNKE